MVDCRYNKTPEHCLRSTCINYKFCMNLINPPKPLLKGKINLSKAIKYINERKIENKVYEYTISGKESKYKK